MTANLNAALTPRKRCEYCGGIIRWWRGAAIHCGARVACLRIRALLLTIAGFNTPESRAALKHFEVEFARSER